MFWGFGSAYAQPETKTLVRGADERYSYEKVFDAPGYTKDQIFESLKTWVIRNVKSQSNTNYFDEKDKNSISTVPVFPCVYNSIIEFKLVIDIKDGKYLLSATSFMYHNPGLGFTKELGDYHQAGMTKKAKREVIIDADESFAKILTSIQSSVGKKKDW